MSARLVLGWVFYRVLIQSLLILVLALSVPACSKSYNVGDQGPAGGLVFYDKGTFSDGWRYLEAAPAETEFRALWSSQPIDASGTDTGIGTGRANTHILYAEINNNGEEGTAAQLATELKIGKFRDWFLPSKDELDLMYKNLHANGVGDFEEAVYWTSSFESGENVWDQSFVNGHQYRDYYMRSMRDKVRAVRMF